jgi:hypothetical protein
MRAGFISVVFGSRLVVLAGCGGGGGGGGSSSGPTVLPAATITETNKKQVAGTAIRGDFRSLGAFAGAAPSRWCPPIPRRLANKP